MPGLSTDLVCHSLHITPHTKPVKQPARVFKPEIEKEMKEEIEKLLKVGFAHTTPHFVDKHSPCRMGKSAAVLIFET